MFESLHGDSGVMLCNFETKNICHVSLCFFWHTLVHVLMIHDIYDMYILYI